MLYDMEYYAGLFDAEGCVSLMTSGHMRIRLNNTRKEVPELFQTSFGGTIYKEPRESNKTIWSWYLTPEEVENFCVKMIPYCVVKRKQLELLLFYKRSARLERREIRKEFVHKISAEKKPIKVGREYFFDTNSINPDNSFYKWLAGFIEGDGSIRIYEQSFEETRFTTCIGASNTFPEPIQYINQRIFGNLTLVKSPPHDMWKWICSERSVKETLVNIIPFLHIKKEEALIILDFIGIKESKKRNERYSFDQINAIRDMITKVKHLNSQ